MAEEVIRMQEAGTEPVKASEPMGTVISMDAVKPAAESPVRLESFGGQKDIKEAGKPAETDMQARIQDPGGVSASSETMGRTGAESAGGDTGFIGPEYRANGAEAVSYKRPIGERNREFASEVHFTEPKVPEMEPDREKKRIRDFLHFKKDMEGFSREDWILSRIPAEDLMEYLVMEQKKNEMFQKAKEIKEKRIFMTIQIAISMAAIVGVVALLKDNPTVLVNILYITGIVIALWIWRGKQDK